MTFSPFAIVFSVAWKGRMSLFAAVDGAADDFFAVALLAAVAAKVVIGNNAAQSMAAMRELSMQSPYLLQV
jgi:hypothetical protein